MKKAIFGLISIFFSTILFSHPHIFIDNNIKAVFDDDGLRGFEMMWVYDEMYSEVLVKEFDKNNNGRFDDGEMNTLWENEFEYLEQYNYNTVIKNEGKLMKIDRVERPAIHIRGNRIVHAFFIPVGIKIGKDEKEIRISVYDEEYFIDYYLSGKEAVELKDGYQYKVDYSIVENEDEPYYFEMIFPQEVILKVKREMQ